jgi:hypothetical protein
MYWRNRLRLAQVESDLFFRELRFFHDKSPTRIGLNLPEISTFHRYHFSGGGQAGGDPSQVSGHSLRAGYCAQAAIAGLQPW